MPTPVDPVSVPSALAAALGRLGAGLTFAAALPDLEAALDARGIGVEPMDSRAAARAWGVLRAEDRQVVAALYPIDA